MVVPSPSTNRILLHPILRLRRRRRLPLHVARRIRAAALQRDHMVDHVALARAGSLAGGRAGMRLLECVPAVALRAMRPLLSRAQDVHFVVDRGADRALGFAVRVDRGW